MPSHTKVHRAWNYTGVPPFAPLLITKILYLGWVMDFILSLPSVLICATHRYHLVSMISPRDLCLHFDPPPSGGQRHPLELAYDKLSSPTGDVLCDVSDPLFWVEEGYRVRHDQKCLLAYLYSLLHLLILTIAVPVVPLNRTIATQWQGSQE